MIFFGRWIPQNRFILSVVGKGVGFGVCSGVVGGGRVGVIGGLFEVAGGEGLQSVVDGAEVVGEGLLGLGLEVFSGFGAVDYCAGGHLAGFVHYLGGF